jgi:hypothetical protein
MRTRLTAVPGTPDPTVVDITAARSGRVPVATATEELRDIARFAARRAANRALHDRPPADLETSSLRVWRAQQVSRLDLRRGARRSGRRDADRSGDDEGPECA